MVRKSVVVGHPFFAVRDPDLHDMVCGRIQSWLADQDGWRVLGVTESPVTGADGNREFLIGARHD